jgi:sporulation protein YlmC with PRC-barrel domain
MEKIVYFLMLLSALSLVFAAGNSFAKNNQPAAHDSWDWVLASHVIGSSLMDQSGNYVGKVKDLVIDPSSGRIISDIVSTFRSNWSTLAIPFEDTLVKTPGRQVMYTQSRSAERYYGQAPYWSEGLYANQTWPMAGIKASKIIGATVRASNGEVTQIKDLRINIVSGDVWAFLPFYVGATKKLVTVPLSWMPKRGNDTFVLNFVE